MDAPFRELWTRKSVEYHMPVLTGFVHNVPLDPVGIAHVLALKFMEGESNAGRLRELFRLLVGEGGVGIASREDGSAGAFRPGP
jgi:hypothetical protein